MKHPPRSNTRRLSAIRCAAVALGLTLSAAAALCLTGCTLLGVASQATGRTVVKPTYTRLAGQSIGVMVATDRGTQIEFPRLPLDISQNLVERMQITQKNKAEELKETTFPEAASPNAIFAFQKNHPQYEFEPITKIAPMLGVTRLIYIDVESFTLNPRDVLELFRGELSANVKVIEIADGKAKVAYEDHVVARFPEKDTGEGRLDLNRASTYRGTRDAFTTMVVQRFVSYDE